MSKAKIDEKLNKIRDAGSFDEGFLNILAEANTNDEPADNTAEKVIEEIKKRYDKDKKD